ncbi:HET-domain-containing protein [Polyplosphaeria fusca]|uniref:HET-domain-containing protein n=1 Tax=Polyplosphaeria fusca TaxID=682080 RepID=A0A9P4R7S6_9PLEO|nr:HET-domain-containing protein [Polyplosphaeria fusca]
MALIRLLQRKPDGAIVFREPTSDHIPAYAILSHTWGQEEVNFQDMEAKADMSRTVSKAGWKKIQFCAKQAAADGLEYFWVDTCCIDKKNAVELSAAINSMFRWYQNAAHCYVYLSDVSKPRGGDGERSWKVAFGKSRWFTRGWTLQELIAPRLAGFFSISLASIPEAAQFVARERELSTMHKLLYGHSGRAAVVLHGLGGMGKTQLAVEYVRRHKEKHTAIFWLNANDENSLRLSFRNIAQQVLEHCPSTGILGDLDLEGDLNRVVNAVKTWLSLKGNTRWLMIYDNYDNPQTPGSSDRTTVGIRRYLPESDHGSLIITTRSARVSQGQRLHVQKLTALEDGLKILANMSRREANGVDPDAKALVSKLDGLPLALSTAGAYLEHVTDSFAEYLRLSAGYGVHSCVHSWTISVLNSEWDDSMAQLAVTCVASEVPSRDVDEWWLLEQRLLQHIARHEKFITNGKVDIKGIEWALHNLGVFYADQGRLAEAEAMYDRALQGKEEALGAKHTSTLETVKNLGTLYKNQGRLAEAEDMYRRALQGYEEAIGPKLLPTYLPALNNFFSFGNLYARTDRTDAARQMYSRALAGYKSVQGSSSKWCKELEDRLQRL